MNFKRICVGAKAGALTGFVSSDNGSYFGLSAFHVLSGSNRVIDPFDDKVEVFNMETNRWLQFGTTIDGRYYKGDGTINNFGILDYAYFDMFSTFKDRIKNNLTLINVSQFLYNINKLTLKDRIVFGYSVIDEKEIVGKLSNIFYEGPNNRFDVEIEITSGHTNEGDSGMLWRDEYNQPFLMHIRGNTNNNSTKSYATFLDRIIGHRTFYNYEERLTI